jgi:hypothetical protein
MVCMKLSSSEYLGYLSRKAHHDFAHFLLLACRNRRRALLSLQFPGPCPPQAVAACLPTLRAFIKITLEQTPNLDIKTSQPPALHFPLSRFTGHARERGNHKRLTLAHCWLGPQLKEVEAETNGREGTGLCSVRACFSDGGRHPNSACNTLSTSRFKLNR